VIAEGRGDLVPGVRQVGAVAAGDEHRRLDHVRDPGTAFVQRGPQVAERLLGLRGDVAWRSDLSVLIERAGAGGKDQPYRVSGGRIRVRCTGEQPRAADEVHAHTGGLCHRGNERGSAASARGR
jgi:hypothetical protein